MEQPFEWPPELEGIINDLIRADIRYGLKRRTWDALHKELTAKVPLDLSDSTSKCRVLLHSNYVPIPVPEHDPRLFALTIQDPSLRSNGFWDQLCQSLGLETSAILLDWINHPIEYHASAVSDGAS